MTNHEYANGGFIPGGSVPVYLHPDECLLTVDKATKRVMCRRADHLTEKSACSPSPLAEEATP